MNDIKLYTNAAGESELSKWTAEELRQGYFIAESENDDVFYGAIMSEFERRNLRVQEVL